MNIDPDYELYFPVESEEEKEFYAREAAEAFHRAERLDAGQRAMLDLVIDPDPTMDVRTMDAKHRIYLRKLYGP